MTGDCTCDDTMFGGHPRWCPAYVAPEPKESDTLTNALGCAAILAFCIAAWVLVCIGLGWSLRIVLVWAGLVP